ncbi:MAG: phosphonate ABC transporter ATP-binding protein [Acidimicrobiia bacterium]|nr:phosphonate ABC transporter ATP-binding protein [Acidimicrobiia bacterium]
MAATPFRRSGPFDGAGPAGPGPGASPEAPVVSLRDVRKEFDGGDVVALDELTLDVSPGELTVIIGLSGSGKSTLLRHLNGLTAPTSGSVEVLGVDVVAARRRELRQLRRDVGFIFQQFNIVGRLSCMENVLSGALGRLRGPRYGVVSYSKALRREALELLDRVGLVDQAFQRTDTLSGGQQQRVAIARTLMQHPKLVLADEPVASLDPEISGQVMDVLFRVCSEENLSVLCSLHQVDLALGWATRLVGLRDGKLVLDKPAEGLTTEDAMAVYKRLDPAGEKAAEYRELVVSGPSA